MVISQINFSRFNRQGKQCVLETCRYINNIPCALVYSITHNVQLRRLSKVKDDALSIKQTKEKQTMINYPFMSDKLKDTQTT